MSLKLRDKPINVTGGGAAAGRPLPADLSARVRASLLLGVRAFAHAGGALAAPAPPALLSRFLDKVRGRGRAWASMRGVR